MDVHYRAGETQQVDIINSFFNSVIWFCTLSELRRFQSFLSRVLILASTPQLVSMDLEGNHVIINHREAP